MRNPYDKHHVYPKKHRQFGTQKKRVLKKYHRAWHILVSDLHPEEAVQRFSDVLWQKVELTPTQAQAREVFLEGRTLEEAFALALTDFLPDEPFFRALLAEGSG